MKKIYCFGDSLTYGFGLMQHKTWAEGLRRKGWSVENYGINGDVLPNIVARLKRMPPPEPGSYIFFMGGTNDLFMGYRAKDLSSSISDGLRSIKRMDCIPVVGIPMLPVFCIERSTYIHERTICREFLELKNIIDQTAERYNALIVDFQVDLGNLDYFQQLFFDEVHPNEQGAKEMEKSILRVLENH